ncbi:MAG: oligosaccharide flippase family protein [Elusimicrobia bacterium]|nr:oligosaccharide flippase family protein [Elusimicrobiota bacterium]
MTAQGRSLLFARHLSWNFLGQVAVAGVNFFCVPYLVWRLGVEAYGLYILMHAAASYLLLLSLGCGTANMKYLAQFQAAGDRRGLSRVLAYSGGICALGAAAGSTGLFLGARFCAEKIFNLPAGSVEAGARILRCAAAAGLGLFGAQWASSALQGFQRFGAQNLLLFFQAGIFPLAAVALVRAGGGLSAVGLGYAAVQALAFLLGVLLMIPTWRKFRAFPEGPGLGFKPFLSFALAGWLGSLAWIVTFHFDKILIARRLSLAELTLYGVPSGLLQRLQIVPAVISTVLIPMMSQEQGPEARETLARMYLRSVRLLLATVLPVLALLFALMPQFLGLWLGGDFAGPGVWPARILVLVQGFFILVYIPNSVVTSRGRPGYASAVTWAQALLSVTAWIILIPRLGLLGVALGSLLAQALPMAVYLAVVHREFLGISLGRYGGEALSAPAASAAVLLAAVFPFHAWATSWAKLVLLASGGSALYGACLWRLMGDADRRWIRDYLHPVPGTGTAGAWHRGE